MKLIRHLLGKWGNSKEPDYPQMPTVKAAPDRPALTIPARPPRRGRTPEQRETDARDYKQTMRMQFAAQAAYERKRRVALGITHYRWRACDVHGKCDVAARNDGKVFSLTAPLPDGHPAEGRCNSPDWCRCTAAAVIPGFDD